MPRKNKRFPLLVYICSPYRGDVDSNVAAARRYCRFAVERNATPVAPHLLFPQFLDDNVPEERATALAMGLELLDRCNEIWVFGETVSEGMQAELDHAAFWGMPMKFFTTDCEEACPPNPEIDVWMSDERRPVSDDEEDIPF